MLLSPCKDSLFSSPVPSLSNYSLSEHLLDHTKISHTNLSCFFLPSPTFHYQNISWTKQSLANTTNNEGTQFSLFSSFHMTRTSPWAPTLETSNFTSFPIIIPNPGQINWWQLHASQGFSSAVGKNNIGKFKYYNSIITLHFSFYSYHSSNYLDSNSSCSFLLLNVTSKSFLQLFYCH